MNVLIIGCCLHRRTNKRTSTGNCNFTYFLFFRLVFVGDSSIPTDIPTVIREKQDLPRTVIISISIIGVILLLINIGLVAGCLFKKRAKKLRGLY